MSAFDELRRRGYNPKYSGTWYLLEAVQMTRAAGRPMMMCKEVYPALARQMHTTPGAIERSMRTTISVTEPGRTNAEVVRDVALGMRVHED